MFQAGMIDDETADELMNKFKQKMQRITMKP